MGPAIAAAHLFLGVLKNQSPVFEKTIRTGSPDHTRAEKMILKK